MVSFVLKGIFERDRIIVFYKEDAKYLLKGYIKQKHIHKYMDIVI